LVTPNASTRCSVNAHEPTNPRYFKAMGGKSTKKSNTEIKNVQQHYRRVPKFREAGRARLALRNIKNCSVIA